MAFARPALKRRRTAPSDTLYLLAMSLILQPSSIRPSISASISGVIFGAPPIVTPRLVGNDIAALDRTLETLGYQGDIKAPLGVGPSTRVVYFHRNELRRFCLDELRKADRPLTNPRRYRGGSRCATRRGGGREWPLNTNEKR